MDNFKEHNVIITEVVETTKKFWTFRFRPYTSEKTVFDKVKRSFQIIDVAVSQKVEKKKKN